MLLEAGCPEPLPDARELIRFVSGFDLVSYAANLNEEVPCDVEERYMACIKRRMAREPVQYITGTAPFFGYSFLVTPDVLIPRYDTEIVVEEALRFVRPDSGILDLCTGSGCILLAVLAGAREKFGDSFRVRGDASDISSEALSVARANAARLQLNIHCILSDLFENIRGTYDIILSNPPYIPTAAVAALEPEVRDHEPNLALDGKEDGLFFYRMIADEAGKHLEKGGHLILEIGYDQAEAVMGLLGDKGYGDIKCMKDLAGCDRAVSAAWTE